VNGDLEGASAAGNYAPLTGQSAVDADRLAADLDQGAADADQTASDEDQAAADLDELRSVSDQLASERDQLSADRTRPREGDPAAQRVRDAARASRQDGTLSRLASHQVRLKTAIRRAKTALGRDAYAAMRDETARRRDDRAAEVERAIAESDEPLAQKLAEIRSRAAEYRARAAEDRRRAAEDRLEAARDRARLQSELSSAHLDDLTGAYRREIGTVALRQEIARARRANGTFVIAFVDVDGMKSVNDREGHAAGDNVLKTLVWTMRSNLRSFDPVVRYGGDEFICGIGGVELDEVEHRFETIDQSIRSSVGVGISVGLAELSPDETLDRLTARADAALLAAKRRRGR
jgi:diguanylate cyclase (GGDEF)-like protein